jgi:nucleoside-diphosphate-sugar epimerase
MAKILITGGSGFIGANILQYYVDLGYEMLNIDFKPPRNQTHHRYWKNIDINNFLELSDAMYSFCPDYVIHLAARTDLKGKTLNEYSTNTSGSQNVLKSCCLLPSLKRGIFVSSMLVCKPGYIPKHTEDFAPSTIYGQSKAEMEKLIRNEKLQFEWAIVRPTSIWGPGFSEPYRKFFDMVIDKKYFHIEKRSCTKTYGYVENLVYQMDCILNGPIEKIQGNVFYLGDYEPTNICNWANEIASELGIVIKNIPFWLIKLAALGGDLLKLIGLSFPITSFRLKNMTTNNVVDLTNTKNIAPDLPFSRIEGVKKTLQWLKKNI